MKAAGGVHFSQTHPTCHHLICCACSMRQIQGLFLSCSEYARRSRDLFATDRFLRPDDSAPIGARGGKSTSSQSAALRRRTTAFGGFTRPRRLPASFPVSLARTWTRLPAHLPARRAPGDVSRAPPEARVVSAFSPALTETPRGRRRVARPDRPRDFSDPSRSVRIVTTERYVSGGRRGRWTGVLRRRGDRLRSIRGVKRRERHPRLPDGGRARRLRCQRRDRRRRGIQAGRGTADGDGGETKHVRTVRHIQARRVEAGARGRSGRDAMRV